MNEISSIQAKSSQIKKRKEPLNFLDQILTRILNQLNVYCVDFNGRSLLFLRLITSVASLNKSKSFNLIFAFCRFEIVDCPQNSKTNRCPVVHV